MFVGQKETFFPKANKLGHVDCSDHWTGISNLYPESNVFLLEQELISSFSVIIYPFTRYD